MKEIGQILTQLIFRQEVRDDEARWATLAFRTEGVWRPCAKPANDCDYAPEDVNPELTHALADA